MSRKFSVGDRVRVIFCERAPSLIGTVTRITAGPHLMATGVMGWEVDIPTLSPEQAHVWPRAWFRPDHLAPYYDGNEPVAWTDCVWQPNKTQAPVTTTDLAALARELSRYY